MTAFAYRSDISAPQMAAYTNTSTGKSPSPEHSRVSDMMTGDGVEMFTCSVLSGINFGRRRRDTDVHL